MKTKNICAGILDFVRKYNTILVLLVLVLFGGLRYSTFLTPNNIINLFRQSSMLGLVATGMTFVLLTGGTDLSVGAVLALSGVIVAKMSSGNVLLAIVTALAASVALGLINGLLVAKCNVAPFIATLGVMMATRGMVHIVTGQRPVPLDKVNAAAFYGLEEVEIAGLPFSMLVFLTGVLAAFLLLTFTRFGRNVYAVGGNQEGARMMGLNVGRTKILTYMLSGLLAGIAGLVMCSRMGMAHPLAGEGWEMNAIAAVVLGGTLLSGGEGRISGTLFGTFIISIIGNLINLEGTLGSAWQHIINGAALLVAVLLMLLQKAQMERSLRMRAVL